MKNTLDRIDKTNNFELEGDRLNWTICRYK